MDFIHKMEKTPNKFKISSKSGFRICLENWSFFQEPMGELESPTFSLPRKRSTPELHRLKGFLSGRPGSNRRHSAWKADALPTELLPLVVLWGEQDSNLRRYKPTDLQSVLVGRLSISPKIRADGGTRTHDLLITNQLL